MKAHGEMPARPALTTRHPGSNAHAHFSMTSQAPVQQKSSSLIENVCRGSCINPQPAAEHQLFLQTNPNHGNSNDENAGATQNFDRAMYSQAFLCGGDHVRQRSRAVDGMSAVEEEQHEQTSLHGGRTEKTTSN